MKLDGIINLVGILIIFIGAFLLLRGVVLWYWKVEEGLNNQVMTNKLLNKQNKMLEEALINAKLIHSEKKSSMSKEEAARKAALYDKKNNPKK